MTSYHDWAPLITVFIRVQCDLDYNATPDFWLKIGFKFYPLV